MRWVVIWLVWEVGGYLAGLGGGWLLGWFGRWVVIWLVCGGEVDGYLAGL